MRVMSWTRWATCALAISICAPVALADGKKTAGGGGSPKPPRSVAACTAFDQADKGEDAVEFTVRSSCSIPLDCSISWRVVCAPQSKKRRAVHVGSARLALHDVNSRSAEGSAAMCGDDAWAIDSVRWSCKPNQD